MNNEEILYQAMRRQDVIQHSFLKYYSLATTPLGLGAGMAPKTAWALKDRPCIPAIWIHGLECTCYIESFICSTHPLAKDVTPSLISLDYSDALMAAAGTQAEEVFEDIVTQYDDRYTLTVGGNLPLGEQGMFCISSDRPLIEKLKRAVAEASMIIAWGTCASRGCVQAARSNPTQATPADKVITGKPIIKVSGRLPIPDVISAITTYMMTSDHLLDVDRMSRPLMLYDQRIHDKCYHRAHFDTGELVQSWDDDAARKGYCLYKMGCEGSTTYNACSSTCWDDGVPFPIQLGHGCLGRAENDLQDYGSFYSRVVDIPQMGIHSTADTVGLITLDVVATAVGVYAVVSTVDQRKRHNQRPTETGHQSGSEDKQA